MGVRFRKTVKLGKGVKLNVGKRGASLSVGGKVGGVTLGRGTHVRASIPGTGISYSKKVSGSMRKNSSQMTSSKRLSSSPANTNTTSSIPKPPFFSRTWVIVLSILFIIGGFGNIGTNGAGAVLGIFIGGSALAYGVYLRSKNRAVTNYAKTKKALQNPQISRYIQIFDDCLTHIMESNVPDTFFGRLSEAYKTAEAIGNLTDAPCIHNGTAAEIIEALNNDKVTVINAFLDRYSQEIKLKAFELTRGRKQKIESFKLITSEYESQMPTECISYRDSIYASMLAKIENI